MSASVSTKKLKVKCEKNIRNMKSQVIQTLPQTLPVQLII